MKLVGMLDSPYVRRVAVALQLLDLRFEHQSLSVFRSFEQFAAINPVVKAPTLVCDDGTVLMESSLILQYAAALAAPAVVATRVPVEPSALARDLRVSGLALAACEKAVQIIYERALRPAEKRHAPWIERVTGQLQAACAALEADVAQRPLDATAATMTLGGVTVATAWEFLQQLTPEIVPADAHPALGRFGLAAESLPAFRAAPHGDGTVQGP